MGRTRSPDSIQAEQLFQEGMKLVDIAKKMKVPEGTVRRWKSTQRWDDSTPQNGKKKQSERSDKKNNGKPSVRKRGAPINNHKAVGHKPNVPKGNKRALKHGGYPIMLRDALDDEEYKLLDEIPDDPVINLVDQIKKDTIREMRLMRQIKKFRDLPDDAILLQSEGETHQTGDMELDLTVKQKMHKDEYIIRLEELLNRVTATKNKAIAELAKIQAEKAKRELEAAGSDTVNDWIAGVMAEGGDLYE